MCIHTWSMDRTRDHAQRGHQETSSQNSTCSLLGLNHYKWMIWKLLLTIMLYVDEKLVWIMLRSLLEKFTMKIKAIEKVKDITTIRVGELIELLQTFETNLDEAQQNKTEHSIECNRDIRYIWRCLTSKFCRGIWSKAAATSFLSNFIFSRHCC